MKVVFFITKLDYSGGPKMLAWVTNQFAKAGNEVHLLSIYSNEINQPLEYNVHVHYVNLTQNSNRIYRNSLGVLKDIRKIDEIIREIKPNMIISFLYSIDIYYMIYSKYIRRYQWKFIVSMRIDPFSEIRLADKTRHFLSTFADGYVFQSEGASMYFSEKVRKKSTIICNPVTSKTLQYSSSIKKFAERRNIIVLPARLNIAQKRQDLAIKAMKYISEKHSEMRLVILGDGPDKERLIELTKSLKIENYVEFKNSIATAEEFVKDCKIMLLTSDYEGIPNSLVEAMALGINVVATDCSPGGARMLIQNGKNGCLVPKGDYDSIAEAVIYLLDNVQEADVMAKSASHIINEFNEETIALKWIDFANEVLNK